MAPARKAVRIPMPEISGIDLRPLVKRPRPQRPPEGRKRDNDPLQNGGQAGIDDRNDRHDVTIGPTLPDLDVQPFAEERSEEHTSELQSLMRSSNAVFCLKKQHIFIY